MEQDNILILGGGRTGIALDNLMEERQIPHKWIADTRLIDTVDCIGAYNLILLSPGIPATEKVVRHARSLGINVISELEYSASLLTCPLGAVTGTNGKTTVVKMASDMLRAGGKDAFCVGNVGVPLASIVGQTGKNSVAVAEVSSFMLEFCKEFSPHVAAVTNITPDHLNRHGTMREYIQTKSRIFERAQHGDTVILNADDPLTAQLQPPVKPKMFSVKDRMAHAAMTEGKLVLNGIPFAETESVKVKGLHNRSNLLCAALIAESLGADRNAIERVAVSFSGVAHRMEYAGTDLRGVRYYNDSKATNIAGTLSAVSGMEEPFVLIVGGSPKGYDFDQLIMGIPQNCRKIIATGETASQIFDAAQRHFDGRVSVNVDFDQAVKEASECALRGDSVLLSPACASFDRFRDYKERGDRFMTLVKLMGAEL